MLQRARHALPQRSAGREAQRSLLLRIAPAGKDPFGSGGHAADDRIEASKVGSELRKLGEAREYPCRQVDGCPIVDDSFLILVHASAEGVEFTLPEPPAASPWTQVLDTENLDDPFAAAEIGDKVIVGGRAVRVFGDSKPSSCWD